MTEAVVCVILIRILVVENLKTTLKPGAKGFVVISIILVLANWSISVIIVTLMTFVCHLVVFWLNRGLILSTKITLE
ncbi:hypothetical protein [Salinivibrio sp. IB643]|jgi:hypothetical protein|uniref:hypothetical protein n=1 Tax=Salinivibrio TaxID=51366 RepID=UPI0009897F87|nr:hypothetical protein [Salinivibrio sp. IB643]OOE94810.1 hypothetical protein BZG77_13990 [Salinivibrio sp. IB643]